MTGHRPADREQAFRDFRTALAPLEASGKLRGVLVQYHPRFVKSGEALLELETLRRLAGQEKEKEVYALSTTTKDDQAPRSAQILRGLLDEVGVPAAGGIEPQPDTLTLF